jgi:hypothetical protein
MQARGEYSSSKGQTRTVFLKKPSEICRPFIAKEKWKIACFYRSGSNYK